MGEDGFGKEPEQLDNVKNYTNGDDEELGTATGERIVELLEEEKAETLIPIENGFDRRGYRNVHDSAQVSEDGSLEQLPPRADSPLGSLLSNPDETPSVQVLRLHHRVGPYANVDLGFGSVFSGKKYTTICGITSRPGESNPIITTL